MNKKKNDLINLNLRCDIFMKNIIYIDIIIIKNDYYTPYFLEENYKGVNRISPQGV